MDATAANQKLQSVTKKVWGFDSAQPDFAARRRTGTSRADRVLVGATGVWGRRCSGGDRGLVGGQEAQDVLFVRFVSLLISRVVLVVTLIGNCIGFN